MIGNDCSLLLTSYMKKVSKENSNVLKNVIEKNSNRKGKTDITTKTKPHVKITTKNSLLMLN